MQITSSVMPRLAAQIGDYAKAKVIELNKQGNAEETAKWAEGGIYRVAAHTALGAMGGGLGGAVGAAAFGEPGVAAVHNILEAEFTTIMRRAGALNLKQINAASVTHPFA